MRLIAVCLFLLVTAASAREERQDQYAVLVYGPECLSLAKDARYEAPMVNGEPDLPHGKLSGLVIRKETCGHYEVRKVK